MRSGTFISVAQDYPNNRVQELLLSNRVQEHSATEFRNTATVLRKFPELGNRVQELSATDFRNFQQTISRTLSNQVQDLSAIEFRDSGALKLPSSGDLSNRVQEL